MGSGPLLVLVPGMDGTGNLFYSQVPRLARHFTVVTYALRDSTASMDVLVADLGRVLDLAGPDGQPAIIVGESFGGTLALSFALAHPDRVAALVVLNSFAYFVPQVRLRLAIAALGVLPWGAMGLVRRVTAFRLHSAHTHRADIKRFMQFTARTTREGYRNRLAILTAYDVRDRLHALRCPALFLAASQDHLVPSIPQAQFMAAHVPGAAMRVLEGHGHICLIAPDLDLAAIIREWRHAVAA